MRSVALRSSDTSEAGVAASVVIPAGQAVSAPFELIGVDDAIVDGTQTVTITASAADHQAGTDTIDVTDDDVLTIPGDVDGNQRFDANDSFLIHLAKLSGTDSQIDQSKGSSLLSAPQIRANIDSLANVGDVDGNQKFNANDSFLIHLAKLSGTDSQIGQSKGSSPLSAAQIRANIDALRGQSGSPQRSSFRSVVSGASPTKAASGIFSKPAVAEDSRTYLVPSDTRSDESADAVDEEFRSWIDAIIESDW